MKLTVNETAERLGCSRSKIFYLLRAGVLERAEPKKAGKVGKPTTQITTQSVVNYIKGGR